ncbi:MAG: MFS transporter [Candidatus Latescibacteria bacterium]|nr:MFS transporter [Candidatus Latescibacterota bacterium]
MSQPASHTSDPPLLTRSETAKGLRLWLYTTSSWGVYGRVATLTGPLFTGFALSLGATEAHIGLLVSISMATGLIQLLSVLFLHRVEDKKRFIILVGLVEVILIPSVVFIPLALPKTWWVPALFACIAVASASANLMLPLYNSWFAALLPSTARARTISRQTVFNTVAVIISGYALGRFLDLFDASQKYHGFFVVFLICMAGGVGGYLILIRCPFPRIPEDDAGIKLSSLLTVPFRNAPFIRFLACHMAWVLANGLAEPFYSVFMIKTLNISYSNIAIFTNISLVVQIAGYQVWAGLVDRYGSKPILQLLMVPFVAVPLLWVFNRSDNHLLIPLIMGVSGVLTSGISMAVGSLFYGLLPTGKEQPLYFAFWSTAFRLVSAVAPLLGGALVSHFEGVHLEVAGFPVENLQVVFIASAALLVLPNLLLRRVTEAKPKEPGVLIQDLTRGNFVTYAYGLFRLSHATEEEGRGRAMRAMGRSQSPMAIQRLIEALDDVSPHVRSQAAASLGEAKDPRALGPLLEELSDRESDIRPEVVEALGKLGHPRALDPLIGALHDADPRVRISAIRALSEIGGGEAHELLFWVFCDPFDRSVFPTLVETLSDLGDVRIIKPTLDQVTQYRSPVIRLQLLNGVCRAMGSKNLFYRLLSVDDYERAGQVGDLLERVRSDVASSRFLSPKARAGISARTREALLAFEGEDAPAMARALREGIDLLSADLASDAGRRAMSPAALERVQAGIIAIRTFLDRDLGDGLPEASDIFLAVCLFCIARTLKTGRIEGRRPWLRRLIGRVMKEEG